VNPVLLAPLALTAGVLSFTSPCSLPLVPGYLAYMSALPDGDEAGRRVRVQAAARFVAGFSTVFTALGTAVGLAGGTVARHLPQVGRLSGVVLVVAGLLTAGLLRRPGALQRERRPGLLRARRGPGGAFLLGAAFAAGWLPCIGPVLASILAVGAHTQTAAWGAALLLLYSLGLGIPFLVLAAGADRVTWMAAVRRHSVGLERAGGALLTVVGILLLTGTWERLLQPVQRALTDLEWPPV
jgi:cytochrome c-type biogenesis protein